MKKIVVVFSLLMIMSAIVYSVDTKASDNIAISEENFPDKYLREELMESYDVNEDGYLSKKERDAVKEISINLMDIGGEHEEGCNACAKNPSKKKWTQFCQFDCKGISYFENLKKLFVELYDDYYGLGIERKFINYQEINELKNLKELELRGSENIEKLDLTNLKKLRKLTIDAINLKKINITGLKKIRHILITGEGLEKIDLSNKPELRTVKLICSDVEKINVKKSKKLRKISLYNNTKLKKLNLSNNKQLKEIRLNLCISFEKIVFPKDNKIRKVVLKETPIAEVKLGRLNPDTLKGLNVANTEIMSIDISTFPNITRLHVNDDAEVILGEGQTTKIDREGEVFHDWYVNEYLEYYVD